MKKTVLTTIVFFSILLSSCADDAPIVNTANNSLIDITSQDQFNEEVKEGVSLIFYHASWCSKCAAQRPAVEEVSEETEFSNVFFAEVEYEDFSEIVEDRGVNGFPTVVVYKDNVEIEKFSGQGHTTEQFRTALKQAQK